MLYSLIYWVWLLFLSRRLLTYAALRTDRWKIKSDTLEREKLRLQRRKQPGKSQRSRLIVSLLVWNGKRRTQVGLLQGKLFTYWVLLFTSHHRTFGKVFNENTKCSGGRIFKLLFPIMGYGISKLFPLAWSIGELEEHWDGRAAKCGKFSKIPIWFPRLFIANCGLLLLLSP